MKKLQTRVVGTAALFLCVALIAGGLTWRLAARGRADAVSVGANAQAQMEEETAFIKWVDFNAPLAVLEQALRYDIDSRTEAVKLDWIALLAYSAAMNGGVYKGDKACGHIDALAERLRAGERMRDIVADMRYYRYYFEAYSAILAGFVGSYRLLHEDAPRYGLKVYSPVAKAYGFGHCDDFGDARTYGYKRSHLGNDLMGAVGTPVIAVEGGAVQALGWSEYGGWRVGIRSHDGLRYYYYAHMRKDHPYVKTLKKGDIVRAGDVIGYMGMTGYSRKENVDNIDVPHLHFGMQLIFDESQEEGEKEIWIDVYHIVRLLERHRMPVEKDAVTGEYVRAEVAA
ncbi:MAG: peptidoglycan DD-metalloendopeptidase family protein [Clostridiales bacterium]|nr:peptidoglycan DD-metalloendopeptidase family protein [Clostridiales bacterium]